MRAVIAGASAGLGLGCAQALAAEGAQVAIGSRSRERIDAAAESIDGAIGIVGDVSTSDGAVGFVNDAVAALGGIDILIANAGGPPVGTFESTDLDAYSDALNLNLLSTVAMVHTAVPLMKGNMDGSGWGRIVAITSISVRQPMGPIDSLEHSEGRCHRILEDRGHRGRQGRHHDQLTAARLPRDGQADGPRLRYRGAKARTPTRSIGTPEDFGKIAAFLCSDAAKFITGSAIAVDGGAYAGLQ